MQSSAKGGWVSGLDVLHTQQTVWSKISSGCASIDHILGGGIRSHEITEFCTFQLPYRVVSAMLDGPNAQQCGMLDHQHSDQHAGGMPGSGKTQLG